MIQFKKNFFSIFIIFLIGFTIFSCNPSKSVTANTSQIYAPTKAENALLWEVSLPDNSIKSYIFGTIHLIPVKDFALSEETKLAIKNTSQITFEIDMAEMTNPATMMSLMSKIMMPDSVSLSSLIAESDYKLINERLSKIGIPSMIIDKIKPAFLSILIEQTKLAGSDGGENFTSYEMELFEYATKKNKTTGGLETLEFQISLFDRLSYKDQANTLVRSLQETDDDNGLQEMINLYINKDLIGLSNYMASANGDDLMGMDMDDLLGNRNKNWVPIIYNELNNKAVFYAVGAGHLANEDGILALLRKKGAIVKPIFETSENK